MNLRERLIYGAVMAVVVFAIGHFVLAVGSLLVNVVFALAMGLFAIFAVTLATRMSGRGKR